MHDEAAIEGRNPVMEAFRAGRNIDRLFVLEGCADAPVQAILGEAKKAGCRVFFVKKERLDEMSETGRHQGVVAYANAYVYSSVDDMIKAAKDRGEPPFLILLDGVEDPQNLGSIVRTANQAGAHGVVIPKRRAAGLTAAVARASAGAINYTPVARVVNIARTLESLKEKGLWLACGDVNGDDMYDLDLTGPIGLVIGGEGAGVSRLVREKCDFYARIPMYGNIDSLNASVAAGVLSYEIVRQRTRAKAKGTSR